MKAKEIDQEMKKYLDEVYEVGLKNGRIEMKNKILKSLNRDWKLFKNKAEFDLMVKILKKVNRLQSTKSDLI